MFTNLTPNVGRADGNSAISLTLYFTTSAIVSLVHGNPPRSRPHLSPRQPADDRTNSQRNKEYRNTSFMIHDSHTSQKLRHPLLL